MPVSIASVIFTFCRGVNQMVLVQFKLDEHNHQVLINMNVPNENINILEQQFNNAVITAGNQDVTESLCDALEHACNVISLVNNTNGEFDEKLAIMIIDGTLPLGNNPLATSQEFNKRGITLVVVAYMTPIFRIWDFYHTLAHHTGGAYMLLQNASGILEHAILSTLNGEDTLHQAFQHIHPENVPAANDTDDTNEQEQPRDGDGDFLFNHGLSE